MKRLCQVLVVIMACAVARAQQGNNQANIGGLLIASNFAQWTVPQGNQGGYSWSSPDFCKVTFAGVTFNAFSNGTPVQIVDTGNPGNSETVTVVKFHSQVNGCSIQVNPTHVHNTFFFRSSTGGLGEAMAFAGTQLYQVILTPDWSKLGGNTGLITSQAGNTSVTILDQRSAQILPYVWGGSAYVAQPFAGASPPVGPAGGVLSGVYPNPGLASSGALPNGWTVTTQSLGDNSGKAASTAYADAAGARFPGSNGVVFNTSAIASRNAVANDFNAIYGYTPLSPSYFGTLPGCGTAGFVFTPASANCLPSSSGTPGGANTQVQFNSSGAFGGDSTFTFNSSTKVLGFQNGTIGPLGTANSGSNFNSGIFKLCDSYYDGANPQPGCWTFQATPLSGTNPYDILTLGYTGSPTSGQINFPFSRFQLGFGLNADNGSGIVQFKGAANMPLGDYSVYFPGTPPTSGNTLLSCAPISGICKWAGGTGGALAVTPQQFGGFGDAFSPPDGFNTTASSTTVTFTDGSLISTAVDGGKDVWIWGAGAAGVAFHSTIVSVTSNTTAIVAAAPSVSLSNAHGVYGHDDKVAIQSCLQYSSINSVQCFAVPAPAPAGQSGLVGFLVGTGSLQLVNNNALEENSGPNLVGSSQSSGTNLFCEFNGDCLNLASGPIQGANVSNIDFQEDPTQPNSRGIHLNPQVGTFGNGPFTNGNFTNVNVDNPAKECIWFDGGGGGAFNLPNQYVNLYQFWCSGPNQSHPANLILATGEDVQILFLGGQVNGQGWVQSGSGGSTSASAFYPNPLIKITEKTATLGDSPLDIKFIGFTCEVGTQCMYVGNGVKLVHYDKGYLENISTPWIVSGAHALTFDGDNYANSGNITGVAQFASDVSGNSTASLWNSQVWGGIHPAALAVCTGNQTVDFANNTVESGVTTTTGCVTSTATTGSSSITIAAASTASVTASGGAIQTIIAPSVSPGKTLTLYAPSGIQLASGGNISLGGLTSPVRISSGGSATLTLMDSGVTFLLTASTGALPAMAINGVSYSANYSSSDLATRVNSCLSDAITLANGNTTAICDATGETGTRNVNSEIDVGDAGGDPVGLLLPCSASWIGTMTGGTSDIVKQYGGTTIRSVCPSGGPTGKMAFAPSSGSLLSHVFETVTSTFPYIYDQGFEISNNAGGHATSSGIGFFLQGPLNDGTTLENVNVYDGNDTYAAEVYNVSSQTTWQNSSINGNNASTGIFILTDNSGSVQSFTMQNFTVVHPGTGKPAILCQDTRATTDRIDSLILRGIYTESGTDGTTTLVKIDGCGMVQVDGYLMKSYAASSTAPGITVTNSYNTNLIVDNVQFRRGNNVWTLPATAIVNQYTGETRLSDAVGNFSHYNSIGTGSYQAKAFNLQAIGSGPFSQYFDDFFTPSSINGNSIGAGSGQVCQGSNNSVEDQNHPGNIQAFSGTTTATGEACLVSTSSSAAQIVTPNTSLPWTWESVVYPSVLPGTTASTYQAGLAGTVAASPWTTGIGFYLSSANGTANDWYCRYSSTSTDSTIAATVAWTRLSMWNDGTNIHWYINGVEATACKIAIATAPSTTMYPAWSALTSTGTGVSLFADYITFQRSVVR